MNLPLFLARRLYGTKGEKRQVSNLAISIATWGVGIGIAVMILSLCIVFGFKHEITAKVIGFCSHIEVFSPQAANSPESTPIATTPHLIEAIRNTVNVASVQRTSEKFGIIKTDTNYKGIQFRGIGEDYDTLFLSTHLLTGKLPSFRKDSSTNDIIIGHSVATEMNLKAGDKVFAYFFEDNVRVRRFHIAGIYSTDMQQFDQNIIFANRHTVNQLNNWPDSLCTTMEIKTEDFNKLEDTHIAVLQTLRNNTPSDETPYTAYTIKQLHSQIFDWLHLLDLNVWVILILMIILACLTIISGLLILILERTQTIGILKAMGSTNTTIRRTFLYFSFFIIGRGLLFGYILGIGLAIMQQHWHVIALNPEKYYVSYVPILFNWPILIGLGIATLVICVFILVGPSYLISRIRPTKAIHFG